MLIVLIVNQSIAMEHKQSADEKATVYSKPYENMQLLQVPKLPAKFEKELKEFTKEERKSIRKHVKDGMVNGFLTPYAYAFMKGGEVSSRNVKGDIAQVATGILGGTAVMLVTSPIATLVAVPNSLVQGGKGFCQGIGEKCSGKNAQWEQAIALYLYRYLNFVKAARFIVRYMLESQNNKDNEIPATDKVKSILESEEFKMVRNDLNLSSKQLRKFSDEVNATGNITIDTVFEAASKVITKRIPLTSNDWNILANKLRNCDKTEEFPPIKNDEISKYLPFAIYFFINAKSPQNIDGHHEKLLSYFIGK